jgi:formylglycine-generating enzyme required for sulfatase activity
MSQGELMYFAKLLALATLAIAATIPTVMAAGAEAAVQSADPVTRQISAKSDSTFRDCATCPEMVVIPAGSFEMGDAYSRHTVTFAQPFAIGKFEVTQREWKTLMGFNPSNFNGCDACPVENVSWTDTQDFIKRLNKKTGKNFRLPSEAEWEAACRGGESHQYCGSDDISTVAWYGENSDGKTHPVGTKQANGYGVYDMSGNVWEWVEDGWHKNYTGAPVDGSAWQASDSSHILRGGSWYYDPMIIDAAERNWNVPSFRYSTLGFRLARSLP